MNRETFFRILGFIGVSLMAVSAVMINANFVTWTGIFLIGFGLILNCFSKE